MNCDQAFDALTDTKLRGSDALTQHLDHCPRCRDMAEMLDPALDLFGEVVDAGDERESGPFGGAVSDDRSGGGTRSPNPELPLTESKAESTRPGVRYRPWLSTSQRRAASRQDGLRVAAFLMLIAVAMAAMVNVERGSRNDAVAISLPESCQRSEVTESTSDNVVAGCVACHLRVESLSELQPSQRKHATQLVQRCVSCHLDMTTVQHLAELAPESATASKSTHSLQLAACLFGRHDG
jgi:cytochrome c553